MSHTLATGERGVERREPFDLADVAARVAQTRGGVAAPRDLAIVWATAEAHAASVTARAREGGGLDIAVVFPSAD
jgi:hypothetical protein